MSGIGDIIAVAQLGYKFAEALKGYIDEVGTAEESIKALVVEVEQASHRVKELSELTEGDGNTGFLTPVGLDECHHLSSEFKKTILNLRSVLVKTSDVADDTGTAAVEIIDLSQWQKFRWPFIRKALAVPRARLGELKIELQLLMVTASAHKLSKMPSTQAVEKQREDARAKLKRLSRTKQKAASRYRKAQEKKRTPAAHPRAASPDSSSSASASSDTSSSADDDMLEFFVEFLNVREQNAARERRDYELYMLEKEVETRDKAKREEELLARAVQMEKETERKKRKEEAKKEALEELQKEREALEEKKKQRTELKDRLRTALVRSGVEEIKIDEAMDKFDEETASDTQLDVLALIKSQTAASEKVDGADSTTSESQTISSSRWFGSAPPSVLSEFPGDESSTQQPVLEAWSLELPCMRVPLPISTLLNMVKKQNRKSILKSFAALPSVLKEEFHYLMEAKNEESPGYSWQLLGIEITKHKIRTGLFSYSEGGTSVLVILQRQDNGTSEKLGRPRGPPGNRRGSYFSGGDAEPMQRIPSILKKPSDAADTVKQPEPVPTAEPRVRISHEAPQVGYADHIGHEENETDRESLESDIPTPRMRSPTRFPSMGRSDSHMSPSHPAPNIRIYNHINNDLDDYDDMQSTRDRQRSRSRDTRPISRDSHPIRSFGESDEGFASKLSRSRPSPARRTSTDSFNEEFPDGRRYSRSRSRSRPRSAQFGPPMPSINERFESRFDDFEFDGYASPPTRPFSYREATRHPSPARESRDFPTYPEVYLDRRHIPRPRTSSGIDRKLSGIRRRDEELSKARGGRRRFEDSPGSDFQYEREIIYERSPPPSQKPRPLAHHSETRPFEKAPFYGPPPPPPPPPPATDPLDHLRSSAGFPPRRSSSYDSLYDGPRIFTPRWYEEIGAAGNEKALVLASSFLNHDEFAKLRKKAKNRRSSVRKKSGDGIDEESGGLAEKNTERHSVKGTRKRNGARKSTVETKDEEDDKEDDEWDLSDKYDKYFNPDFEVPAEQKTNAASENQDRVDPEVGTRNGVSHITEDALNGMITEEPQEIE